MGLYRSSFPDIEEDSELQRKEVWIRMLQSCKPNGIVNMYESWLVDCTSLLIVPNFIHPNTILPLLLFSTYSQNKSKKIPLL